MKTKNDASLSEFPILTLEHVSKRFGGVAALEDVSFEVRQGQIVGLIGPNGAGKTTLFNCITGLSSPDQGTISFGPFQTLLNRLEPHEVAMRGICRTFQTIRLFKDMTVLENVMVGAHLRARMHWLDILIQSRRNRLNEMRLTSHATKLLSFFKLNGKAHELAKNLSYGHQRKLEIVRALASEPKLLLIDEPAAGMNPREKDELLNLIRAIRDRGITILLIEHDMRVLMPISDRIIVLDYGKKIAEGTPKEIQNHPRVIEAYLGKRSR